MSTRRHPILRCRRTKPQRTQKRPDKVGTEIDHAYGRRILVDAAKTKTARLNRSFYRGDVEFQNGKKKNLWRKETKTNTKGESGSFYDETQRVGEKSSRDTGFERKGAYHYRTPGRTSQDNRQPRAGKALSRTESDLFSVYKERYKKDDDFKQTVRLYPRVIRKRTDGKNAIKF